ncbi:MAG: glycosyltransferase family 1 protein [Candidatus Peribacteraceae bacterium]|jgi:glycosyltransferase involved in cell wall biosynthesis
MHIGIDCRFAATHSGLGRYTREIVTHMLQRNDPLRYTLFVRDTAEPWLAPLQSRALIICADIPHYSFAEQLRFPALIRRAGVDALFSPHFNVPLRCPVPHVLTVHDLILHRYPNRAHRLKQMAYRFLMRSAVLRARQIIAVSRFTAGELAQVYGESVRTKTTVVYEGVSTLFRPVPQEQRRPVLEKYGLYKPYFLYVGNAKQHKNVQMLINAYASLQDSNRELVLMTGGCEHRNLRLAPGTVRIDGVPDHDLPALYSGALACVSATAYEGFGLPFAEALACGCRVIVPRMGAIPEVVRDHGVLVEPQTEAIAEALARIDALPVPPPTRFATWEETAERVVQVLGAACF